MLHGLACLFSKDIWMSTCYYCGSFSCGCHGKDQCICQNLRLSSLKTPITYRSLLNFKHRNGEYIPALFICFLLGLDGLQVRASTRKFKFSLVRVRLICDFYLEINICWSCQVFITLTCSFKIQNNIRKAKLKADAKLFSVIIYTNISQITKYVLINKFS